MKKKNEIQDVFFLLLLILIISTNSCSKNSSKTNTETFRDDFNGDSIDATVWQVAT